MYFIVYFILLWGQELERAQAKVAILEKDLALEVHRREEVCKHHDKVSSNMSPYLTRGSFARGGNLFMQLLHYM